MGVPANNALSRFMSGLAGQVAFRIVYSIYSLLQVPLLIGAWGLGTFGNWLAITALTSYLTYSNFGLMNAAANDIVMAVARNDIAGARRRLSTALTAIFAMAITFQLVIILMVFLVPLDVIINTDGISAGQFSIIVLLMSFQVWVSTFRGLVVSTVNSAGLYGQAYGISAFSKLVDLVALIVVIGLLKGSPVAAAAIGLLSVTVELALTALAARRGARWATYELTSFDRRWLIGQLRPSLGFITFIFTTQGVLLQLPRLALSIFGGGGLVAVYSVYVTCTKLFEQAVMTLLLPIEIETSRAFAAGRADRVADLTGILSQAAALVVMAGGPLMILFGSDLFSIWTRGSVPFDGNIMLLFMILALVSVLSRSSAQVLTATNSMFAPSLRMLALALAGIALGCALLPRLGMAGMAIGTILAEGAICLIALSATATVLNLRISQFLCRIVNPRLISKAWVMSRSSFGGDDRAEASISRGRGTPRHEP